MNVDILVRWGYQLLHMMDAPERLGDLQIDRERSEANLGWIREFRTDLAPWRELLEVIEVTETLVRTQGVYRGVHRELKARLSAIARGARSRAVSAYLVAFLAQESLKAKPTSACLAAVR